MEVKRMIVISDLAVEKIKEIMQEQEETDRCIRIKVTPG
jgi:Fe-S cluster assembly iron-binding protein IscA